MRSLVVALASALLLAVVVTEFIQRLWPESYLALLVTTAVVLFINGIFNQRVAGGTTPQQADNRRRGRNEAKNDRGGKQGKDKPREKSSGSSKPRDNQRKSQPNKDSNTAAAAAGPRETGEVKWFNRSKGFGFIIRDSGEEIFVHQRSIRGSGDEGRGRSVLRDGEPVEFVVTEHDKGLQAEDVVPTNRS